MLFPLGPYHPALTEPIQIQLDLKGDIVRNATYEAGYLHRGIEAILPQCDIQDALDLIEHTCGTCSHAHRLAMCIALEEYAGVIIPQRAAVLRMVFAEVERVLARLWLLQQLGRTSDLGRLFVTALEAREILFEGCVDATGSRLLWSIPVPGGVQHVKDPLALVDALSLLNVRLLPLTALLSAKGTFTQRTSGISVLSEEQISKVGGSGLLARAANLEQDVRLSASQLPYETYSDELATANTESGNLKNDVAGRARLALAEIHASLRVIFAALEDLPDGQELITFPSTIKPGTCSGIVESPHGRETVTIQLAANSGSQCDITLPSWMTEIQMDTPSMHVLPLIPDAMHNVRLTDVPLALASLDICLACADR